MVEITHIETPAGVWTVALRGDECCLIDAQGRERHRSKTHRMTAASFALALAREPFDSAPNLDEALRDSARRFLDDPARPVVPVRQP